MVAERLVYGDLLGDYSPDARDLDREQLQDAHERETGSLWGWLRKERWPAPRLTWERGGAISLATAFLHPPAGTEFHKILSASGVEVLDEIEVARYIATHRGIEGIIVPLARAIRERFPRPAQLSLWLDSESPADRQYLVLNVRLPEYPDDVLDVIDDAYSGVVADLANTTGFINATTDFRRVRA